MDCAGRLPERPRKLVAATSRLASDNLGVGDHPNLGQTRDLLEFPFYDPVGHSDWRRLDKEFVEAIIEEKSSNE